ncbi:DUF2201 family putative metallopeptidase [Oribacterium parvum]|uniref:DUF2201 family putative metallopeptidase n=1 Tax=Oribacterium parvum TaxID=1501329 RepID=UPI0028DB0492|nr:VWA-like domain-containing protein [Oribacterium parvum]
MGERKGTAQGALNSLGLRILNQAKIELSLSMRYLSRALDKLSFQMDFNTRRIGTEGEKIHFHPEFIFQLYVESPQKLYRLYMHSLLHCLFRHMFKTEDKEEELWNLATDIHVEYVLDSMDNPLLYRPAYPFRENYFQKLEKEVKSLSAERIYAYLLEQNLSYEEKERLESEFVKDDHSFWAKLGEEERPVDSEYTEGMEEAEGTEDTKDTKDTEDTKSKKNAEAAEDTGSPEVENEPNSPKSPSNPKKQGNQEEKEEEKEESSPNDLTEDRNSPSQSAKDGDSQSDTVKDGEGREKEKNGAQGSGESKDPEKEGQSNKGKKSAGEDAESREKRRKALDKDWEDIGKRTEEEMKDEKEGEKSEKLSWFLHLEHKNYTPFQEFLRKFSVDREELKTDPESFDFGYYYFGLSQYGNMPLIEENEYREKRKIPELVIAIDTSYSTKGEMVKRFLEEALAILADKEAFFTKCRVHIIECDDRIRKDLLVEDAEEMERYRERFEVSGGYGTDFRPVFYYIEDLQKKGELKELKALLYFTDGRGRYPKYAPSYTAAFIFPRGEDIDDENAPFWALKLYI